MNCATCQSAQQAMTPLLESVVSYKNNSKSTCFGGKIKAGLQSVSSTVQALTINVLEERMTVVSIVIPVRPCVKCGATERGKSSRCKPCARASAIAWQAANPERAKAKDAAWYAKNIDKTKARHAADRKANPERVRASELAWKNANPDKAKAYSAAYYAANTEKAKAYAAAWNAANPERKKVRSAAWRAANPEARRVAQNNRRAKQAQSSGKLSPGLSLKLFALQKGLCPCCAQPLGNNYHMDHIIPLALGGANTDDNIQLLRQRCNNQKHTKHPIDFMQSRGFLL